MLQLQQLMQQQLATQPQLVDVGVQAGTGSGAAWMVTQPSLDLRSETASQGPSATDAASEPGCQALPHSEQQQAEVGGWGWCGLGWSWWG